MAEIAPAECAQRQATVGVLGGMGPAATVDFFDRLVRGTPVGRDQDHPRVLIDCNPHLPDRNLALKGAGPSPGPDMASMAQRLEAMGAQFLVIPCNTAHAFLDDVRAVVSLPIISMVEEATLAAASRIPSRVGLLAADGCLAAGLYQTMLEGLGLQSILLAASEQQRFMTCIYEIKAGQRGTVQKGCMETLAAKLIEAGADVIIAACTEVPLVLAQADCRVPLIDATEVLVQRTVSYATGAAALPPTRDEDAKRVVTP